MKKPPKTNAVRLLETHGIPHELLSYDFESGGSIAEHAAEKLGLGSPAVFKTLVVRGDKTGAFFAVVSGHRVLDLKKLASCSGNKRVELVAVKEVEPLTGYVRGGVTAIGSKKRFPVLVDELMTRQTKISVSAGRPGLQMLLAPSDYLRLTEATLGDISSPKLPGEMELEAESG